MYSQLHLKIANIINDNYYDKLVTNLANEKYNNRNFIISPYDIDKKYLIDIDNKMIDLMYNDLINTNNILDINERINYIYNKSYKEFDIYTNYNLVKKLIENENYIVLHDILINSEKNTIKSFLEDELYTRIGYKDSELYSNKKYITLKFNEENKNILELLGQDDRIKQQYLINFMNNLNKYLNDEVNNYIENKYEYIDVYKKRKELYIEIIDKYLIELNEKSYFNFNDIEIKDKLENIIKNIDQNNNYPIFINHLMDYLKIDEYDKYLIFKNHFDSSHSIFKYLTMNENLFENKNYLKKDNENILEIKNENVSLIKQLLTTIKDEPDLNNKKIMFDKLMTHLKINLEFKDLDFLYINTKKEIKDLNKEDFEKDFLFKMNDFDNKIKDLDIN